MAASLLAQEVPKCLICYDSLIEDPPVSTLVPCGHTFHAECINLGREEHIFYDRHGIPVPMKTECCPICRE